MILLNYDLSYFSLNMGYIKNTHITTLFSGFSMLIISLLAVLNASFVFGFDLPERFGRSTSEQNSSTYDDTANLLAVVYFLTFSFIIGPNQPLIDMVCASESFFGLVIAFLVSLFIQVGLTFIAYLKGTGQSLSVLYNLLLDSINKSSFVMRFFIQFIRVILVAITLYSTHILSTEICCSVVLGATSSKVFSCIHVLFETVHLYFLIGMQAFIFLFFFNWLFSFLISCNSKYLNY